MMVREFILLLAAGTLASCRQPQALASPQTHSGADWLSSQSAICGTVVGRVIDARDGTPMRDAFVTLDTATRGVGTDSLGYFRVAVPASPALTQPTTLRIRRIGAFELTIFLPRNIAYVVEAHLAPQAFHLDATSTLRLRTPGSCVRAT